MAVIVGAVALVLVVIAGGFFVLGRNDDSEPATSPVTSRGRVTSEVPTTEPTTSRPDTSAPPEPTAATSVPNPVSTIVEGTKVYPMEREPTTLDPAAPGFVADATSRVFYNPLFFYDRVAGQYVPLLAEGYEVVTGGSQAVWTIRLRPGVMFHDGTPFDAEVVVANVGRHRLVGAAADLLGIRAVDELVVELTCGPGLLDEEAVLELLSGPVGFMAQTGAVDLARHPIGTGPYTFAEWVPGEYIVALRFDDYWQGVPPTETLIFVAP